MNALPVRGVGTGGNERFERGLRYALVTSTGAELSEETAPSFPVCRDALIETSQGSR